MRSANVSSDVLQIVKQDFPDGCYLAQVLEKYLEMYPDLTHKQARIKVDKSLRFQEKKGYLRSVLDEGLKRRYSLVPEAPTATSIQEVPSRNSSSTNTGKNPKRPMSNWHLPRANGST